MKRNPTKKSTERRKRARGKSQTSKVSNSSLQNQDTCYNCSRVLGKNERALFVEEEIGRTFCSENCIANYFTPEIERLEKDYFRHLSDNDLSADERESLAHLRWITLQEPDEVWREKTLTGDHRYTLISEFQPGDKRIWCICISLCLRGEPSFLFMAFVTRNAAMMNCYRKGERVQWVKPEGREGRQKNGDDIEMIRLAGPTDGLATDWTEDETLRAQMVQDRKANDIPSSDFELYQSCLEESLEAPDEVWSIDTGGKHPLRLYHFIRFYPEERPGFWYVIVARETDEDDQIELLDAFPTLDAELVEKYRRGRQEFGSSGPKSQSRVVH